MKFASWVADGIPEYGAVDDGAAWDLSGFRGSTKLADLLPSLPTRHDLAAEMSRENSRTLDSVRLLPPIPDPRKILCVGTNYRKHLDEIGRAHPTHPVIFSRFSDSLVGHLQPIVCPSISPTLDWEGELAVIISRDCFRVQADDAMYFVGGYSCCAENAVRGFQRHNTQVTPGKTFFRSGALGPWLVSPDEVAPHDLTIRTWVNGELEQDGSTKEMIFGVPEIIAYISSFTPLSAGDVIATGTPSGVGGSRTPPMYLSPGDVLEVEVEGIGRLTNPVVTDENR